MPLPTIAEQASPQRAHVTEIIPNLNLLLTSLVYPSLGEGLGSTKKLQNHSLCHHLSNATVKVQITLKTEARH